MSLSSLQLASYGGYVWSCYGLTLAALVFLAVYARQQWRSAVRDAQRRVAMQSGEGKTS